MMVDVAVVYYVKDRHREVQKASDTLGLRR